MNDIFNYHRRATVDVNVGGVMLGSKHSVKVQSMTNTNTDDIEASVAQCRRIADCGRHRSPHRPGRERGGEHRQNPHRIA